MIKEIWKEFLEFLVIAGILTASALLGGTWALQKFESEHYIIIMPKSDVKKAVVDIDANRAKAKHQAKVKPIPKGD